MEVEKMKAKPVLVAVVLCLLPGQWTEAELYNDGAVHNLVDGVYESIVVEDPPLPALGFTSVNWSGATVFDLEAYDNSRVTVNGGNGSLVAHDDSHVTINDGSGLSLLAQDNSHVTVNGGYFNFFETQRACHVMINDCYMDLPGAIIEGNVTMNGGAFYSAWVAGNVTINGGGFSENLYGDATITGGGFGRLEDSGDALLISGGDSGDVYEQALVKTLAGFFRGNSTHLFGVIRFGAPGVYVRTGSIHLNEVVGPQSPEPGTESGTETGDSLQLFG
jgi:hypothetical protein